MKPLNFNKNSWHYRLVNKLDLYKAPYQKDIWGDGELYTMGDSGDICTYSKQVVFALFIVSIGIAAFILLSIVLIHMLLGIYFSVLMSQWFFSEFGEVGMIIFGSTLLGVAIYKFIEAYSDNRDKNRYKSKPDTFVGNTYRAWKNKFCVPINFE